MLKASLLRVGAAEYVLLLIRHHLITDGWSDGVFWDELAALYRNAAALVMASYFGPTNLPPLEAWAVGTPVIYPEAFAAQAGDAAMLFDYDDPVTLADAIEKVDRADERARLVEAGQNRLRYFAARAAEGRQQFAGLMQNRQAPIASRLSCGACPPDRRDS